MSPYEHTGSLEVKRNNLNVTYPTQPTVYTGVAHVNNKCIHKNRRMQMKATSFH